MDQVTDKPDDGQERIEYQVPYEKADHLSNLILGQMQAEQTGDVVIAVALTLVRLMSSRQLQPDEELQLTTHSVQHVGGCLNAIYDQEVGGLVH